MSVEVIYPDGSMSTYHEDGGAFHDGRLAIERLRLLTAHSALRTYIESGGLFQLTRNGATLAIKNVIEPLTGKHYKRSMKGKEEAFMDCEMLLADLESLVVFYEQEEE